MTCAEAAPQLSAYLDRELSPVDRVALEAHLGSCDACTELLGSLRRSSLEFQALPSVDVGADFRRRVLGAIEAQRQEEAPSVPVGARRLVGRKSGARWAWPTLGAIGTLGAAAAVFLAIARGPVIPGEVANEADLAIAGQLELFENYRSVQLVDALDAPEDLAIVAELDQLGAPGPGEDAR